MTTRARLQLVVPFHQPPSADEERLAAATDECYAPLLEAIAARPQVKVAVHFSGHLLDFLAKSREAFLLRVRQLVKSGQLEVLGGLFYGGVPALLPDLDTSGQLQMSTEFWESYLGSAPHGFWLNDLAWCPELPRLFEDSGFTYGFVSQSQIASEAGAHQGLVTVERGEQRLSAFVLDDVLSAALPSRPAEEWVGALGDRLTDPRGLERLTTVWVRAESLGLEPGTRAWVWTDGWLNSWLDALANRDDLALVLPAESAEAFRPAVVTGVRDTIAPELGPQLDGLSQVRWDDFVRLLPELQTLHRLMLKVSAKLRDAISTMEDEGYEHDWSDTLATAQRLVFSAQASDAYWRGQTPGGTDPALRDAIQARLSEAEQMIDTLVQGEDDWIATDEEDRDGDGVDEVFVTTAHLGLWLDTRNGASLRALDWRTFGTNVFDVGSRRPEAFFSELASAPRRDRAEEPAIAKRGTQLARLGDDLPTAVDREPRSGVRLHVLDQRTTAAEFFSGSAKTILPAQQAWEVTRSEIDDQGDYAYHGETHTDVGLLGVHPRQATIERRVLVPIDAPALELTTQLRLEGEPEVVLALELPIRLGTSPLVLTINGNPVTPGTRELHDVRELTAASDDGQVIRLASETPFDLWLEPVARTVRSLAGYERLEEGVRLVPNVTVAREGTLSLRLELGASSSGAEAPTTDAAEKIPEEAAADPDAPEGGDDTPTS